MKDSYYYISSLLLFGLEMLLAILITDVTTVFDLVAAIAVSCLGFFFPAFFYLAAERKFGTFKSTRNRNLAYFFNVIGFAAFAICMFSSVWGFFYPE